MLGIFISNTAYVVGSDFSFDVWKFGYFDLSVGIYYLEFIFIELYKIVLDDVKVVLGFCSQLGWNFDFDFIFLQEMMSIFIIK